jgi:two-component system chemotaxis sensor kinase CheA
MSDKSLLQDFIAETGEHLEETERNLLQLEQQQDDAETLNKIFRSIHTIKGSSEYLGLERVAELSHKLESLLELLRRGERSVNSSMIDLLMTCNDRIGALVEELDQHEEERSSIEDLVSSLKEVCGQAASGSGDAAAEADRGYDEDEYDEELFGIFVEQLKEGLSGLAGDADQLSGAEDGAAILETSADRLVTLRSSSNYMGYDELKGLYEKWSQSVDDAIASIKAGDTMDLEAFAGETMLSNIESVKALFPKVSFDAMVDEDEPAAPDMVREPQTETPEPVESSASDGPEADQSLLADFITETGEHLEETERNLLQLEQQQDDAETLNRIFRSIHTIKGSSEYLGLERVAELSHKLESLLELLRRGERSVNSSVIDLLMACNDRIGALVEELDQHQQERSSIEDLVSSLKEVCEQAAFGAVDAAAEADRGYDEVEYDQELFGIFVEQLREGLSGLAGDADQLSGAEDAAAILETSADRLVTLQSSSNYMAYDELKGLYEKWSQSVDDAIASLKAGDTVDLEAFAGETMLSNIERVKALFPKVSFDAMVEEDEQEAPDMVREPQAEAPEPVESPASDGPETDQSLLADFITETGEHLEETERNLLQLEQQPDDVDTLNEIFRSVHTIKGSSEYLGMIRIAELAHKLESLLDLLRHSERSVDRTVIDLLITCNDRIGVLVSELEQNKEEESAVDDLLSQLETLIADEDKASKTPDVVEKLVIEDETGAIYGEEHDHELFSIYLEQLNNGLKSLSDETDRLRNGESLQEILERCEVELRRLLSSANYMEYEELRDVFNRWLQEIADTLGLHVSGEAVDIDAFCIEVMAENIQKAKNFFSTMHSVTEKVEDITEPVEDAPAEADAFENAFGMEINTDFSSITLNDVTDGETPIELEQLPLTDDDDMLLDKLASAFDSRLGFSSDTVKQYYHEDVENDLFSEDKSVSKPYIADGDDTSAQQKADDTVVDVENVESMLFSGSEEKTPFDEAKLPEQVPAAPVRRPKRMPLQHTETAEPKKRYNVGRRQSDKFRDRMLKQSIRVDSTKIDALMNQVGELVVSRSGFNQLFSEMRELQSMLKQSRKLDGREMQILKAITNRINEATTSLGRVTSELQENVMKVRMLPIAQLFSRYPRVVHDLVRNSNKKVNLEIYGEDTELDKKVIEQLADPLIHIIRNAVDHGIEDTATRRQKGKDETGTIRMEAYPESNYVVIEISDDGRGIDTGQIRERAIEKELITSEEAAEIKDEELLTYIMRAGFSTADEVTLTSGRGVGMDVVKDNIEKINGTIDIFSSLGTGARFRIKIPLTLAIIPALLVGVADEIFTIPLSTVDETLRISKDEISSIEGMEVCYLRENAVPIIRLKEVLRINDADAGRDQHDLFVVIINAGTKQVGFVVDELKGRQEVVIKPLEDYLQEKSGFSGATILGDGSISLILDVFEMVQISLNQQASNIKEIVS